MRRRDAYFAIVPGLKFSMSTSADAIRRSTASSPLGSSRPTAMLFLLRLNMRKNPAPVPISRRVLSPERGSTLITSAPRSPRIMPQVGPITMCENSTTRTPPSGNIWRVIYYAAWRKPLGSPARAMLPYSGRPGSACSRI